MTTEQHRGDIIDQGNAAAELFTRAALSERKPEGPQATGCCLNCGAPVEVPHRWCDADCRDDWQKAQDAAAKKALEE